MHGQRHPVRARRTAPSGEDGCHRPLIDRRQTRWVAKDAREHGRELTRSEKPVDLMAAEARLQALLACDNAVLSEEQRMK